MSYLNTQITRLQTALIQVRQAREDFCKFKPTWLRFHQLMDSWVEANVVNNKLYVWAEANALSEDERALVSQATQQFSQEGQLENQDTAYRSTLWAWTHSATFKTLEEKQKDAVKSALSSTIESRWPKYKRQQLNRLLSEQEKMEALFAKNLRRDQAHFGVYVERLGTLNLLEKSIRKQAKEKAKANGWDGWWFEASEENYRAFQASPIQPSLKRTMTIARKKVGRTYHKGPLSHNGVVLARIAELRRLEAKLHGSRNYGLYAWSGNVFTSPRAVSQFLRNTNKAIESNVAPSVSPSEAQKYEGLKCNPQKAIHLLFSLLTERFHLTFENVSPAQWLKQPRLKAKKDGTTIGFVILDIFKRPGRLYSGVSGFMVDVSKRHQFADGRIQLPTAYLSMNSNPHSWSHYDCSVFFHEMGHVLHQLACTSTMPSSNWDDIERDGCEWPSVFMELWSWEKDVVRQLFGKRNIPLLQKIEMSNRHRSMSRGLQISWMDLQMHASNGSQEDHPTSWFTKARQFAPKMDSLLDEDWARWDHLAIMQGTYSGYLWAEQLAYNLQTRLKCATQEDWNGLWEHAFTSGGESYAVAALEKWSPNVTKLQPDAFLRNQ